MPGLHDYHAFLEDLEAELSCLESVLSGSGLSVAPCRLGCSSCCLPLTLLPLEAYAIMSECEHKGWTHPGREDRDCAFLTPDRTCAIYPARPFLCRTRGFPIFHMNEDGEWDRDSCAKRGFSSLSAENAGLHLETWNARLFRLNESFCAERGIASRRVRMADLCVTPLLTANPA